MLEVQGYVLSSVALPDHLTQGLQMVRTQCIFVDLK